MHDILHEYRYQLDLKDSYTSPLKIGAGCPTFNPNDTWASLEDLVQYLSTQRGRLKTPLDYIIQDDKHPFHADDNDHNQYHDLDRELAACAQILRDGAFDRAQGNISTLKANGPFMPEFKSDAKTVWHIIKAWGDGNKAIVNQLNTQKTGTNGHIVYFNLHQTLHGVTPLQIQIAKVAAKMR